MHQIKTRQSRSIRAIVIVALLVVAGIAMAAVSGDPGPAHTPGSTILAP